MALRPLPQPHIGVVDEKRQGTPPWREYWSSLDAAIRSLFEGAGGAGASFSIVADIDGAGATISTGVKTWIRVPFAGTITGVTALANQTGSAVVDIWKDTYANYPPDNADSITASAPVTITTATKSEDTTLTGWNKDIVAGDILVFNLDSVTSIQHLVIEIRCVKT